MRIGSVSRTTIKRIRTNKTLTMKELAARVGLSIPTTTGIFYNHVYHDPGYTPFYRTAKDEDKRQKRRLSDQAVIRIFKAKGGHLTQARVAAREGVTQAYVSMIQSGKYHAEITSGIQS